ncbi:hypothetical protein HK100_005843 [Physocladia obscura]|uniref:Uncharacterized protein n=1 Tax=Physocladia obscura TaxID=109957 RepID=A0AAD5STC4_9FUNG|nr:hypothetical protein HK100_005843 [Physocladia obscura]
MESPKTFVHLVNDEISPIHTLLHDRSSETIITATQSPLPHGIKLWSLLRQNVLAVFQNPNNSLKLCSFENVTAIAWDRPNLGVSISATSLLVSAHSDASILLWRVSDALLTPVAAKSPAVVLPFRKIQVTPITIGLSTLAIDPFKIVVTTREGHVRIYDSTTGFEVKSASVRRGGDVGVRNLGDLGGIIVATGEWALVVANAAGHVRSWDFSPGGVDESETSGKNRRLKKAVGTPVAPTGSARSSLIGSSSAGRGYSHPKSQIFHEVKNEIRETSAELKLEKLHEETQRRLWNQINGQPSFQSSTFGVVRAGKKVGRADGNSTASNMQRNGTETLMTEQELIDYAIMISRDEAYYEHLLLSNEFDSSITSGADDHSVYSTSNSHNFSDLIDNETSETAKSQVEILTASEKTPTSVSSMPRKSFASVASTPSISTPNIGKSSTSFAFSEFLQKSSVVNLNLSLAWYDQDWDDEESHLRYKTTSKRPSLFFEQTLPPAMKELENNFPGGESADWESDGILPSSSNIELNHAFSFNHGRNSVESLRIRRSPRLSLMSTHVSPKLNPQISPSLAPTTRFVGVGVQVAPRANLMDEDEELQYVLALSLTDQ